MFHSTRARSLPVARRPPAAGQRVAVVGPSWARAAPCAQVHPAAFLAWVPVGQAGHQLIRVAAR
eukprot:11170511-Lingulodinium_polyedra.AAC.1